VVCCRCGGGLGSAAVALGAGGGGAPRCAGSRLQLVAPGLGLPRVARAGFRLPWLGESLNSLVYTTWARVPGGVLVGFKYPRIYSACRAWSPAPARMLHGFCTSGRKEAGSPGRGRAYAVPATSISSVLLMPGLPEEAGFEAVVRGGTAVPLHRWLGNPASRSCLIQCHGGLV
jgi:hypothetical protein